ncbi:MAG: hypothetical protein WC341_17480, partial [Bacteroidales bacterium]
KTFRGMEGYGLNADLYINGVKCYFVIDEGNGGCFNYQSTAYGNPKADVVKANIDLLEKYIDSLPEEPLMIGNDVIKDEKGNPRTVKKDLDVIIDELYNEMEKEKAKKKMQKLFTTAIVFGVPDADSYRYLNYKRPLKEFPVVVLQGGVNKAKAQLKAGEVILNDNLESLGVVL